MKISSIFVAFLENTNFTTYKIRTLMIFWFSKFRLLLLVTNLYECLDFKNKCYCLAIKLKESNEKISQTNIFRWTFSSKLSFSFFLLPSCFLKYLFMGIKSPENKSPFMNSALTALGKNSFVHRTAFLGKCRQMKKKYDGFKLKFESI